MIEVHADRLFTGTEWLTDVTVIGGERIEAVRPGGRPSAIRAPLVLPGLVDAGVWAEGYLEGPGSGDGPFIPEEGLVSLCRAHGVTSLIDIGSPTTVAHWLVRQQDINAVSSLGRVCGKPSRRCDLVAEVSDLPRTIESLRSLGATHVVLGDVADLEMPEIDGSVVRTRQHDGVTLPGFSVHRGSEEWIAAQATACSLWTVDDMLKGPDATMGRVFLPYLKHFEGAGNFMGRRIARGVLSKLYGDRSGEDLQGWPHEAVASRPSSSLLASSGAGSAGVVPGQGLWSELQFLEEQVGFESALRAATAAPAAAFPALDAGLIEPGQRMDLLLCSQSATTIAALRGHLDAVVVGGRLSEVGQERKLVQSLCLAADRRAI